MKIFKTLSMLAAIWALSGIPGFINTLPSALDYKLEYALLVFGHALAGLCIVAGAMLSLKEKVNVAKWLLVLGCVLAAYGKMAEGYNYQYPLFLSLKFNSFDQYLEFKNGFSIDLPFAVLAGLMTYYSRATETENSESVVSFKD